MKVKLRDLANVIRSKNAGPYELTFDVILKDRETYHQVVGAGIFTKDLLCRLYKIKTEAVIGIVFFEAANAIKMTIERPLSSGAFYERDVYGACQHAPLLDLEFDL